MNFRLKLDQFSLMQDGNVITQPATIPYHLTTSIYTNLAQISDISLKFSLHLCPSELPLPTAPAKTSLQEFFRLLDAENCLSLPFPLSASQHEAMRSLVVTRHSEIDLSDLEVGLNIPFNQDTYHYCWKSVSVYALVYSTLTKPAVLRFLLLMLWYILLFLSSDSVRL